MQEVRTTGIYQGRRIFWGTEKGQTIYICLDGNLTVPGDGKPGGVEPITYQLSVQVYTAYSHKYIHKVKEGVGGWTTISASPEHNKHLPIDQFTLVDI